MDQKKSLVNGLSPRGGLSPIGGLIVPLLTPLTEDFSIDSLSLKALVARLMNKGVKNFFALSPIGEYSSLDEEKQREVLEIVAETAGRRLNVITGCFGETADEVIERVVSAQKLSRACVVNIPLENLSNDVSFVDFFDQLFLRTKADIMIYNNPFVFKRNVPVVELDHIANWERLIGFIDASRNMDYFKSVMQYSQSFKVYQGVEDSLLDSIRLGSSGAVCSLANVFPTYFLKLLKEFDNLDVVEMIRQQSRLSSMIKDFFPLQKRVQAYKYVLTMEGIMQPFHFYPLNALDEREKQKLEEFVNTALA